MSYTAKQSLVLIFAFLVVLGLLSSVVFYLEVQAAAPTSEPGVLYRLVDGDLSAVKFEPDTTAFPLQIVVTYRGESRVYALKEEEWDGPAQYDLPVQNIPEYSEKTKWGKGD